MCGVVPLDKRVCEPKIINGEHVRKQSSAELFSDLPCVGSRSLYFRTIIKSVSIPYHFFFLLPPFTAIFFLLLISQAALSQDVTNILSFPLSSSTNQFHLVIRTPYNLSVCCLLSSVNLFHSPITTFQWRALALVCMCYHLLL